LLSVQEKKIRFGVITEQYPLSPQAVIARSLQIKLEQVAATVSLLADGASVPFVARYRKEATGLLDEIQIEAIRDQLALLGELDRRRESMRVSLVERKLLTDKLNAALAAATDITSLEDVYLPFRPKRRTRAMIAREKGLEPLARKIFVQDGRQVETKAFIKPKQGVQDADEALAGARDIIAEWISEDVGTRARMRKFFADKSKVISKVVKKNREQGVKFSDYFDRTEPVGRIAGHRLLAMLRGEKEKVLVLSIRPPEEQALALLYKWQVKGRDFAGRQVALAAADCYRRLLAPSLENDLRQSLKKRADREAIEVFAENLRQLLLAPPMGQKRVMALDPGFRTGAKLVCLDGQGNLLYSTTIFPTYSGRKADEARATVVDLCRQHRIEAIAIGNGTAGRETEEFVRALSLPADPIIAMVDERGASVYSASATARNEFPDHDLTVRGAVSIGRRLQDPLAELVKIDPRSIGVGQYQHDVNQLELQKCLNDVVVSCVNGVGVEVNTASAELLTFVSGVGPTLAQNIINYRNEHGPFTARSQLLKVARLGAKAFEQCAGFIRIHGAANPLDGSGVHPERYGIVERMAGDVGCPVRDIMEKEAVRQSINVVSYLDDKVGMPTLSDIMEELAKPGRDPRDDFSVFSFAHGVHSIDDLEPGMKLPGIVTNITKFGVFVDIGVHQDGLIHISQLADRFVKDPAEVVRVGQQVEPRVLDVDLKRKRIALSLRQGG
jgi:uncharacterized protein